MRLATWNVYHGRNPGDGSVDPARLADAVAALGADALALQEVDRGQPRSALIDVTRVAADAMKAVAWGFVPTVVGDPAGRWRPASDDDFGVTSEAYGIALISRYPVASWHLLRLAPAPLVRAPVLVPGTHDLLWLRDEPRAVLAATLQTPDGPRTVACTHLSYVPGINVLQLRRTMHWLRGLTGPRVLMGDLNLPGAVVSRIAGARLLARARTYPASRPRWQVDHVVSDGWAPTVLGVSAPSLPLSDHAPLVVDLETSG